jgi:hypothetical protein
MAAGGFMEIWEEFDGGVAEETGISRSAAGEPPV